MALIRHMLVGDQLPSSMDVLDRLGADWKTSFMNSLHVPTRPWTWAASESPNKHKVERLLHEHGVPIRMWTIDFRCYTRSWGKPWGSQQHVEGIEMVGEQIHPPVQIISPAELQHVVDQKAKAGQVGNRSQKKLSKGKGKGKPKHVVDQSTVFTTPAAQVLSQLDLSQANSTASGIVSTTVDMAPFLQTASAGAPAFAASCVERSLPVAGCKPTPVQFPVECVTNDEPLLVTRFMYNVGSVEVAKAKRSTGLSVKSVEKGL